MKSVAAVSRRSLGNNNFYARCCERSSEQSRAPAVLAPCCSRSLLCSLEREQQQASRVGLAALLAPVEKQASRRSLLLTLERAEQEPSS